MRTLIILFIQFRYVCLWVCVCTRMWLLSLPDRLVLFCNNSTQHETCTSNELIILLANGFIFEWNWTMFQAKKEKKQHTTNNVECCMRGFVVHCMAHGITEMHVYNMHIVHRVQSTMCPRLRTYIRRYMCICTQFYNLLDEALNYAMVNKMQLTEKETS